MNPASAILFDYDNCVQKWNENWEEICSLAENSSNPLPKFEDIISDSTFSYVTADLMKYVDYFTVSSHSISTLFRGVREADKDKVNVNRFIPNAKYLNPNNPSRMNGPDRLYSYFTIGFNSCQDDELIYTSAHELRLVKDDLFWGCYFSFNDSSRPLKFINLCSSFRLPETSEECQHLLRRTSVHNHIINRDDLIKTSIQIIFGIWSKSNMFAPIDDRSPKNLWLQYRPFHILCDYFERLGFDGIIYRSTVYKKGICLALFNIDNAVCKAETIKEYNTAKYIKRKK